MPRRLKKSELHMKAPTGAKTSAHAVDFGSFTVKGDDYTALITKLNKHEGVEGEKASVLEVGFSEIASLYIKPGLTPPAQLVVDDSEEEGKEKVIGVASEHVAMQIKEQMTTRSFYSFDPENWTYAPVITDIDQESIRKERETLKDRVDNPETISDKAIEARLQLNEAEKAVNFLDKMPKKFFAKLMAKHAQGEVIVDMESLASILTASYVLEEDDLHKGNIGFYVTETQDEAGNFKKKFVFFKIDHDLLLTDSIMSQRDQRPANILYNKNSFKITGSSGIPVVCTQ